MEVSDLIGLDDIFVQMRAGSKKQVLSELAESASQKTGLDCHLILDKLLERERLGSTGVGEAIAIPHGKITGLEKIVGLFAKLEKPVDFDSMDDQPVDIVFMLLVPEDTGVDHLKTLSKIARLFREPNFNEKLRQASSKEAAYALLVDDVSSNAA